MSILRPVFNLSILFLIGVSCNNEPQADTKAKAPQLKEENISYSSDSVSMNGFVVYDQNQEGARPAVLVVPEWWGLNDYAKRRATELAQLGYIAIAIDMYGNGLTADNPDSAGKYASAFYQNPAMAKARIEAAMAKLKTYPQTDSNNIAAVGYCFGGGMLLNVVRLGTPLKGIVSFHGSLNGTPVDKALLTSKILVCHGGADPFVPKADADQFKHQMDSAGITYTFIEYPGAMHAFTNPNATAMGEQFKIPIKYDAVADTASWKDMKAFLSGLFK